MTGKPGILEKRRREVCRARNRPRSRHHALRGLPNVHSGSGQDQDDAERQEPYDDRPLYESQAVLHATRPVLSPVRARFIKRADSLWYIAACLHEADTRERSCALSPAALPGGGLRLLLVEDNADLADLTGRLLGDAGFEVDRADSILTARQAIEMGNYAAIILDLGLPDGDGETVLRWIRSRGDPTPVLVLTARGTTADRVTGLEKGADDYIVKPFAQEELIARLRAILRRPAQYLGKPLLAGNVTLDAVGRQIFVDDAPQMLSARELAIMEILMKRLGRVVPKKLVEDHLFGLSEEVQSNAVEVYVHRLRKQLASMNARVEIHTVRGLGYLLTESRP